jgi:replicative DNA helicase
MTDKPRALYSLEAEQALVGGLLMDAKRFDDISDIVKPEMLHDGRTHQVYTTIVNLVANGSPVDPVTVSEAVDRQAETLFPSGSIEYIVDIAKNVMSTANLSAYAHAIKDKAKERSLFEAATQIQSVIMQDGLSTDQRYQEAEAIFTGLNGDDVGSFDFVDMNSAVKEYITDLDWRFNNPGIHGIKTGLTKIDERLHGLNPGELYIVAGRPGSGKTTYAMNMIKESLQNGDSCYFSSLEMPRKQLLQRLMASAGRIHLGRLKDAQKLADDDWTRITNATHILRNQKLFIDDTPALDINEMRSRCRRIKRKHGLKLVAVDYLQLLEDRGSSSRFDVVSSVSRKLKALAKELEVPVIALSQLSRKVEERNDKRPIMSDLRESGQIEQDADVIQFLYRDEYYNEDSPKKGVLEVITAKFRDGEVGTDYLAFIGAENRIADLSFEPITEPQVYAKPIRGYE